MPGMTRTPLPHWQTESSMSTFAVSPCLSEPGGGGAEPLAL